MTRIPAVITAIEAEVKYHCLTLIIYLQNKFKRRISGLTMPVMHYTDKYWVKILALNISYMILCLISNKQEVNCA